MKLYEWKGALPVPKSRRDKWAREVLKDLKAKKTDDPSFFILSGDSMVVGYRYNDDSIDIWDVQIRRHAMMFKDGSQLKDNDDE